MTQRKLVDLPVREFLDDLASNKPVPGGGSVSGLAGALACSLSMMVGNLTIGKEKFAGVEASIRVIIDKSEHMRERFIGIIDEDAEAFEKVMAAFKLPKSSNEEKALRQVAIQDALEGAALVPLNAARVGVEVLRLTEKISGIGNPNAISDAGCAALLGEASVHGALLNVEINAGSIKDTELAESLARESEALRGEATKLKDRILAVVHERM